MPADPISNRDSADNPDMDDNEAAIAQAPGAGVATTMVQRGVSQPLSAEGLFAGQHAFRVSIAMTEICPFEAGEGVLLACGEIGDRVAALAAFQGFAEGVAVFTRLSPWRPVNTRRHPRYRTELRANVRRKAGNLHATVVDISRGGLALTVDELPGVADFDVRVGTKKGSPYLPCRLIYQRDDAEGKLLHIRFREMDGAMCAYVDRLIGELCTAMEPGLDAG
jgi:hypothetical protein